MANKLRRLSDQEIGLVELVRGLRLNPEELKNAILQAKATPGKEPKKVEDWTTVFKGVK